MKIQLEAGIEKDDDNDGDNTKLPTGRKKTNMSQRAENR